MKKRIRAVVAVVLTCLLTLPAGAGYAQTADYAQAEDVATGTVAIAEGADYAPGQAIVCVKVGYEGSLAGIADDVESLVTLGGASDAAAYDLVLVKSSFPVDELLVKVQSCEGVAFAEPNYEVPSSIGLTDDPVTDEAAGLKAQADTPNRDFTSKQYAFGDGFGIDVPQWNTYDDQGNPTPVVDAQGAVVAVLDTGVDYTHADLRDAMWSDGENYPSLVAMGGGANGINLAPPRTDGTAYDTTDPMDDDSHGTHVAGIIAGSWNGVGISGAASGAKVMAVKLMNNEGAMDIDDALRGYRYVIAAQREGVPVVAINNSWGDEIYSRALDLAVLEAGRLGAVTVFAASNERSDIDMADQAANSFANNPYAVVVANSDKQGEKSESSNFGKRAVDLFAPGHEIYSTVITGTGPGDEYADPLVAGDVTYSCDFESVEVKDNAENGVFQFKADDATTIALADEGHESAHSLSLAKTGENESLTVSSKTIDAGAECRGLCFWMKVPSEREVGVMLAYDTQDGLTEQKQMTVTGGGWQVVSLPIVRKAAKDNLKLNLSFTFQGGEAAPVGSKVLVDDIKLVCETTPYDFLTGTSQASPAVAGGAAVLAAAFPEDDAAKRAARIAGSVKPVASLADLCVSGGVFNLRKALDGDTAPVLHSASTSGNEVTIKGFFFGQAQGSLSIDGQALSVVSWSDTEVVAQLPSGFSGGEKLVELTTTADKKGHQRFRIGTPASLYRRLPLPGRSLNGDPGEYTVTSHDFDESFYAPVPRALVGLDDSLYYLLETEQETTAIYRYDIAAQTWELVYEDGYAAGGGACTWDGKILFVAGQPKENKTYLGLYDPTTGQVEYTLISSESFERGSTLLNTGKGILLAGGVKSVYGSSKRPAIEIVRTVDPATMTVSQVEMPGDAKLPDSWYASAYDEEGHGYLFCGTMMKGMYRFTFADGKAMCEVLEEGSVSGEKDAGPQSLSAAQAEGSVAVDQVRRMAAGSTKDGIVASGPVMVDDSGAVTADTYSLDWGQTKFKATDKLVSVTKMYNQVGTAYRGNFYVIADSDGEEGGKVFASQPVETIEQPGDVASPVLSQESETPKATAAASKVPATGDMFVISALALFAFAAIGIAVAVRRKSRRARSK